MTFKDLLEKVSFEESKPLIHKMYPDMKGSVGLPKLHYNMLKLLPQKRDLLCNAMAKFTTVDSNALDGSKFRTWHSLLTVCFPKSRVSNVQRTLNTRLALF